MATLQDKEVLINFFYLILFIKISVTSVLTEAQTDADKPWQFNSCLVATSTESTSLP